MSHDRHIPTQLSEPDAHKYIAPAAVRGPNDTVLASSEQYFVNKVPGTGRYKGPEQNKPATPNMQQYNNLDPRIRNDNDITYQRTPVIIPGQQYTPPKDVARPNGLYDAATDGPTHPGWFWIERSFRREAGTQRTQNAQNNVVPKSNIGYKDAVTYIRVQDPIAGNPRFSAPEYDENGKQSSSTRVIAPSGPYGMHTRTVNPTRKSLGNRLDQPQQRGISQDRLANSGRAGQTFSQQTKHVPGTPGAGLGRSRYTTRGGSNG